MVKRRSRFMPGFQSRFMPARPPPSTRSTVRASTVGPYFPRRSLDDDALYVPYRPSVLPHYSYDTSGSDYATQSDINRELIMSTAAMEDNYDISTRSRQRDKDVLAAANRAIVDTEVHSTARGAVAALRVARGHSTPPAPSKYSRTEYDPSMGKPYWGVEGVRKPNLMSWQYRLDTYMSPDDLIIVPRSLNSVRTQLREAHDKLDHHKQLVDRYLVADKGFSVEDSIVLMNIKSQAPYSTPASLNEAKKSDKAKKSRRRFMQ